MLRIDVPSSRFGMHEKWGPQEQPHTWQDHPCAYDESRHNASPLRHRKGDHAALVVLFRGTKRAIRLSVRWIADDLYLARLRPRTGSHADVHINNFIAHVFGQGREWLSIHHRINARFVNLARSRTLLDFDQLCPPVRIQFETNSYRFTAGAPPHATDLLRPTTTHQDTHLLPIGFPAPGIGKGQQIFFRHTTS